MVRSNGISVVIPCFNAATTIADAIESALAARNIPEVIVVDDGSSDNSFEVVNRFNSTVRILSGPNRGVSAARNRGIAESRGQWIVFLDADDVLTPGTLEMRLSIAERSGADVVICDWQDFICDGDRVISGPIHRADMAALADDPEIACATDFYVRPAALMYRRTLVERIAGFREDLRLIEDARFLFDAACQNASFVHSPHIGARIRTLPNSLSRSDPALFWQYVLLNGRQIEDHWGAHGSLSSRHVDALLRIFDNAARGLFAASHPDYFTAIECQHNIGKPFTRHSRFAPPLARALGLRRARYLFRLMGR